VHWLQRSTWLPADIRGLAPDARVEPAMFVQPSAPLIVLQPAVPGLQAFDLETGRRVWQRAIPDLHRVAGSGGGLLVAMTPRGLLVFHAADGAFAWHHEFSESPFASAICEDGHVVTASIQKDENGKQQLFLKWFDRGEDRRDAVTSTAIPAPPMASIAGLGSTAGRFFVVGSSHDGATAWLSELVPVQPPGD
jgi:hypothetical protein